MAKQISIIILLTVYLTGLMRTFVPYLDYMLNKEYIVTELCVNKDKPEMECNGMCYLMTQVEETQSPAESPDCPAPPVAEELELPVSFLSSFPQPTLLLLQPSANSLQNESLMTQWVYVPPSPPPRS